VSRVGSRCGARVTFKLPLLPGQLVPVDQAMAGRDGAVVPVDLLITGDRMPDPVHVPLRVAVPQREATVAGTFVIDLTPHLPDVAQAIQLFAFSGEHVSAPANVARLDTDVLTSPLA
jgi:hypothetical protein